MTDLPEPLTPSDCDLRGLPFMPMDTIRVVDSDLFAMSNGEEFKAAFALWCKAWQQIPAGSLPDDDRVLAYLSGAGARWKKLRPVALRNWQLCSDGRLYHPVVAEKALEALPMRQEYKEKKTGEADRKKRERDDRARMFEQLRMIGVTPVYNIKTCDLRELVTQHVTPNVTPVTRTVTAKTGTGTGTVIEEDDDGDAGAMRAAAIVIDPFPSDLIQLTAELCRAAGIRHVDPGPVIRHQALVKGWLAEGFDPDTTIAPAIRDALSRTSERIGSLQFFDHPIRQFHARKEAQNGQPTRQNGRRTRADDIDDAARNLGFEPLASR